MRAMTALELRHLVKRMSNELEQTSSRRAEAIAHGPYRHGRRWRVLLVTNDPKVQSVASYPTEAEAHAVLDALNRIIGRLGVRRIAVDYSTERASVLERDGHACRYCGSTEDVTVDHLFPQSRGGTHEEWNLVAACRPCNSKKHDRTPLEARMQLRPVPAR